MIPWYWLLMAFAGGGLFGAFVAAVCAFGRDDP
jgi:hypothetical protein